MISVVNQVVFALTWFIVVVMGWPCGTLAFHMAYSVWHCMVLQSHWIATFETMTACRAAPGLKTRIGPIEVIALIVFIGYARTPRAPRDGGRTDPLDTDLDTDLELESLSFLSAFSCTSSPVVFWP